MIPTDHIAWKSLLRSGNVAITIDQAGRLAGRLQESLEQLSAEENTKLWAEQAVRRDKEWDADPSAGRPARDVMRDAFAKLN